jgi:hypothetical protein
LGQLLAEFFLLPFEFFLEGQFNLTEFFLYFLALELRLFDFGLESVFPVLLTVLD